jgi:hypothetical protein
METREIENRLWSIARELDDIKEELHDIKVLLLILAIYAGAWLATWIFIALSILAK